MACDHRPSARGACSRVGGSEAAGEVDDARIHARASLAAAATGGGMRGNAVVRRDARWMGHPRVQTPSPDHPPAPITARLLSPPGSYYRPAPITARLLSPPGSYHPYLPRHRAYRRAAARLPAVTRSRGPPVVLRNAIRIGTVRRAQLCTATTPHALPLAPLLTPSPSLPSSRPPPNSLLTLPSSRSCMPCSQGRE
ncbi:unnamed protein product [Closterium sp. NIES-65]|nr:unnamed protein product [Closterium sp. NIES-65]